MREEQKTDVQRLRSWNSSRLVVLFVLVVLISGCINVDLYDKPRNVRAKELNAGKCYLLLRKEKKNRKSPTGKHQKLDNFRMLQTCDTIKADLNVSFGIEFIVWSKTKTLVPIKMVWTFPEAIVNEKGKEFEQIVHKRRQLTHERTWVAFKLSKEFMLVKGDWKLEIFYKKNKLLEKTFYLI